MSAPRDERRRKRRLPTGQTSDQSDAPFPQEAELIAAELAAAAAAPLQLELTVPIAAGGSKSLLTGLPELTPSSSLDLARAWYRLELERKKRPRNTIESYSYDLAKLEERTGPKPIDRISRSDIAKYLGLASNRATRKRRLTSVRRFFEFLIVERELLTSDPTEGFYPHAIPLRSPSPLFASEQTALLDAAAEDEPWSLPAILLMLRFGVTRAELLALRREHIDLSEPARPVVHVVYDDAARQYKERRVGGDADFTEAYAALLNASAPPDLLFPVGFQAVNGMVERVRLAAGIDRPVTPQVLRHTFAVERARGGADEALLLELLGLLDEPRNRESVRRYLKLAEPPL
jgi:integrase/recombinase XerD